MTAPREILPGRTSMVSRRCTQRQLLLRPDRKTNEIFAYCLAEAAKRYGIGLVAWIVMSNHYHAIVYDPNGQLPAFTEHLHKFLAKVLNVRWERWENMWSTEETCITYLPTPEDIFRKVVYVLANPVADDLVERVTDWPGCHSFHHLGGKASTHRRPPFFFRKNGVMPESVELEAMLPPSITEHESADAWVARVRAAVAAKEQAAREDRRRNGRRILGRQAVLRESPFSSPSTAAPRRNLRPSLARAVRKDRIAEIQRLLEFRIAHEAARRRYIAGEHDVEFPAGTYRMRRWGARCCAHVPIAA
jgi:putative transposase